MVKISHYEVYTDRGDGWKLEDRFSSDQRYDAMRIAKEREAEKIAVKILKEDFDNTGFASTNQVACVHDERTWQVFVTQMAKDTEVCDHETTGGIVSRVWMKKKGVIAFVLYHSGSNHQESGFWVFRAPQNGFSVIVR